MQTLRRGSRPAHLRSPPLPALESGIDPSPSFRWAAQSRQLNCFQQNQQEKCCKKSAHDREHDLLSTRQAAFDFSTCKGHPNGRPPSSRPLRCWSWMSAFVSFYAVTLRILLVGCCPLFKPRVQLPPSSPEQQNAPPTTHRATFVHFVLL